jgi:hypothetical protein
MEARVLANALFVVDDFSPAVSAADARIQEAKAEKLIRGSANHSATGRLRPDATMRPAKPPRAQVLASAEDLVEHTNKDGSVHDEPLVGWALKGGMVVPPPAKAEASSTTWTTTTPAGRDGSGLGPRPGRGLGR